MNEIKFYGDLEKDEYIYDTEIGQQRLKEIEKIYEKIKNYLGKVILDIGCGAGLFSFYLEQKGHKVIGIDVSKELLKEALRVKKQYHLGQIFC